MTRLGDPVPQPVWMATHLHKSGRITRSVGYTAEGQHNVQYADWWPNEIARTLYVYEHGLPMPVMGWGSTGEDD